MRDKKDSVEERLDGRSFQAGKMTVSRLKGGNVRKVCSLGAFDEKGIHVQFLY